MTIQHQVAQLTEQQERQELSDLASMRMEGLYPTAEAIAAGRELAIGLIDFPEYRRRVGY